MSVQAMNSTVTIKTETSWERNVPVQGENFTLDGIEPQLDGDGSGSGEWPLFRTTLIVDAVGRSRQRS